MFSQLYDSSGGFGREIKGVIEPDDKNFTGYAGGLNPGNVRHIVSLIEEKNPAGISYYIDMESGVREDNVFSVAKSAEVIAELSRP